MKRLILSILVIAFTFLGCDSLDVNTNKSVKNDPIGDITLFNGNFHTTNVDTSGNAGPQIDLIRLSDTGERLNNTPLELNGQGYMAIADDEDKFYLLSRRFNTLYTVSTSGQRIDGQWADLEDHWQATALTYVDDEEQLLILYRNSFSTTQYRARLVNSENINDHSRDLIFKYQFVNTGQTGIYSLAYHDSNYYMLGVNQDGSPTLIEADSDFEVQDTTVLGSSEVAGLAFKNGNLHFSFFDGRVEEVNR